MRLCNILTKGQQRTGDVAKPAKYTNAANPDGGYLWDFNQIQPGWDSYDIDYPLPVRIIADTKDGEAKCYEDAAASTPRYSAQSSGVCSPTPKPSSIAIVAMSSSCNAHSSL